MSSFTIPTADELDARLGGLDRLLKAKRWERAAIVWAFTEPGTAGRPGNNVENDAISFPCALATFARLGFAGLTQEHTVARYRNAWQAAIDADRVRPVRPGDEVDLPDLAWPPDAGWGERQIRDDGRRLRLVDAAEAAGVSSSSVLRAAASPEAVRVYNSTLSAEEKAEQVRAYLDDPAVVEQVADREIVEKVARAHHAKQPIPKAQLRDTTRDYDQLIEQAVNGISVALSAESSGKWTPNTHSEAFLYFLARTLSDRQRPPGNWDDMIREVEAFANSESS